MLVCIGIKQTTLRTSISIAIQSYEEGEKRVDS